MMPTRIQRERKRGWRKPKNSVCVNRGTPYGNPFIVDPDKPAGTKIGRLYQTVPTIEDAVACYREYLQESPDLVEKIRRNLRGKTLLCFCPLDQPCHADVLLELANKPVE
jgi:hypothetical protein